MPYCFSKEEKGEPTEKDRALYGQLQQRPEGEVGNLKTPFPVGNRGGDPAFGRVPKKVLGKSIAGL